MVNKEEEQLFNLKERLKILLKYYEPLSRVLDKLLPITSQVDRLKPDRRMKDITNEMNQLFELGSSYLSKGRFKLINLSRIYEIKIEGLKERIKKLE